MTLAQTLLGLAALGPFLSALLIAVTDKHYRWLTTILPFFTLVPTLLLAVHFSMLPPSTPIEIIFGELIPGIVVGFKIEALGIIFACVVAILWPISILYTLDYLDANQLRHQQQFYFFFSVAIGCTLGIAFAGDLLTLLIFYELLTLSTYPLVTHNADDKSRRAGHIYLGFLLGTSFLLLLPAVIWTGLTYGTLSFESGGIIKDQTAHPALLALFVFGVGKAALLPLHRWLPAAMVAPVPVSALLHAVAVVKAGVFTLTKIIVYIFGLNFLAANHSDWLVYVAGTSIVIASTIALYQNNLKRRLAYSTISQLAYITMGAALLKPALIGAVFHLVAHAFSKITLFFAAGAIQTRTGKHQVSELNGIGRVMPWTMICFTCAALALIGLPPTAGFISKWYLLNGAIYTQHFFAIGVLIISTLLNAAYFIPIIYRAFAVSSDKHYDEKPSGMLIAMLLTTLMIILLFFFNDTVIEMARQVQ